MILVLCPTLGRPAWAREVFESFRLTASAPSTRLVFVLERDDPRLHEYLGIAESVKARFGWSSDQPWFLTIEAGTLVRATNDAASRFWDRDLILGHVGDDHRFASPGWDDRITEALASPGVAYGNDGHWGELMATSPFVSAVIPRALGWLALPTCSHNGWDNAVMDIGRGLGALHYLPDVHIDHPDAEERRASADEGYRRARGFQDADKLALGEWRDQRMAADIARLREALAVAA